MWYYLCSDRIVTDLNKEQLVTLRDLADKYELTRLAKLARSKLGEDVEIPDTTLNKDFTSVLNDSKYSDVALTCDDGTRINVHKCFITIRCKFFRGMFCNDTEEASKSEVRINDVTGNALTKLIEYLYTDQVEDMGDDTIELFGLADRFALLHLKSLVEEQIRESVQTKEEAETALQVGELYDTPSLVAFAQEKIKSYDKED